MFELAALAYQADITRVPSYMMAKDASMISHTNLGISEPHHSTTHHLELPESIPNLVKINTYHMSLFSRVHRAAQHHARRRRLGWITH